MKQLLFRADDLGYSEGVNLGIAKCVKQGLIRNVGVMINMPEVQLGLVMLQESKVCLGLHCNISSGLPLSDPLCIPSLVDEHGAFKQSKQYANTGEDIVKLEEVLIELEAQYQQFLRLTGKKPAYMDGHAVASAAFFHGIELIANKHEVLYSPYPNKDATTITIGKTNVFLHAGSTLEINPSKMLQHIIEKVSQGETHMIVYHPGFVDAYLLQHSSLTTPRAFETQFLCDPSNTTLLATHQLQSITYEDLQQKENELWPL